MANPTNFKQVELAHEMAAMLKFRTSLAISELFDTNGAPMIQVGTGVAGSHGGLIRVIPVSQPLAKDILGLAQESFCPSVIQLGVESGDDPIDAQDNSNYINNFDELVQLLGECMARAAFQTQLFVSANGVAPVQATLDDATKLKSTFIPTPQWGISNGQ